MRDLNELLDCFENVTKEGNHYVARCPICGHLHRRNHLQITPTGNTVKIHCMIPDCNANGKAVMDALGKPLSFLYLDDGKPARSYHAADSKSKTCDEIPPRVKNKQEWYTLSRTHEYKDLQGKVQYIKAVYKSKDQTDKTCRWFTVSGAGYIWGLNGAVPPLFNADKLNAYGKPDVFFVEGEKDCSTMELMGRLAVSSPHGAGSQLWAPSYSEALRARDVTIIADNDEPGRNHAIMVAAALDGIAQSVRIINAADIYPDLQDHGDISDIYQSFQKEATAMMLQEALDKPLPKLAATDLLAQLGAYTASDLTDEDRLPPEFIVDGMIPVGMTFLSGAPKVRKSFMALMLANAVATGVEFLGHSTKQCSVLYLDLEGTKNRIATRTESMGISLPDSVILLNNVEATLAGEGDKNLTTLIRKIHKQHPEIRLVIVDTYSQARGTVKCTGANAYDQDVAFLKSVQRMAQDEKIALMFIHHEKKGANFASDSMERSSGSMGITGTADSILSLVSEGKRSEGKASFEWTTRDAPGGTMDLIFDPVTTQWEPFSDPVDSVENTPIARYLLDNKPKAGTMGDTYSYSDLIHRVFPGNYIPQEEAASMVKKALKPHLQELYLTHGLGLQFGVKSNGQRGIRVYVSKW